MDHFNSRIRRIGLCFLLLLLLAIIQGCGHVTLNMRAVFNSDGSANAILHISATGEIAQRLDRAMLDDKLKAEGWTGQSYTQGGILHKIFKKKFPREKVISSSPMSLLQSGEPDLLGGSTGRAPDLRIVHSFPYTYYVYEETVEPMPRIQAPACPLCRGKAGGPCPDCQGTGGWTCGNCQGAGLLNTGGVQSPCSACNGVGRTRCPKCSGTGKISCQFCANTGGGPQMQQMLETALAQMTTLQAEIQLPGTLLSTNADRRTGNVMAWSITIDRLHKGMKLSGRSRELNKWAVYPMAVLAFGVVLLVLTKLMRRRPQAGPYVINR